MMNFSNMMKQAQEMQKKLQEVQKEFATKEYNAEAGNGAVKVTCDGQGRFKSIKIAPEAINPENPSSVDTETLETLEDLVSSALSQAAKQSKQEFETRVKQITGGIHIPGLF